jgi:hypothetical protein
MSILDRATNFDLIEDDIGHELHGRCGLLDGICACVDSSFNRWPSGYFSDDEKDHLKRN